MCNIQINTTILEGLNPCQSRLENWKQHNATFNGSFVDFLELTNEITHRDKIWVAVRLLPRFLMEVFAIDCAFRANGYAAAYAADADADADADAAAYAAYAAYAATDAYAASVHAAYAYAYAAAADAAYAAAYAAARKSQQDLNITFLKRVDSL